jgi:malate/lactate dehydrogenase
VNTKVAVLGAAGGIGQPMSLLLKLNPRISQLALFDIVNTPGVAADLSHISTPAQVKGYTGTEQLRECLEGAKVVVIPAGVPRKPGTRQRSNSEIAKSHNFIRRPFVQTFWISIKDFMKGQG